MQRATTWRGFSRALAVATKEATDASSVVTQETTDKDSMSNYTFCSVQSLSPFVRLVTSPTTAAKTAIG
ncbi:hypothetical protein KL86DES1_10063 [uncultured Desulfovibrio sp.]|uniref:Uncharacterized protein n=1 Tax=uncultured Desulfovibrio sp. TaxID=167968 RepID=A0A212KXE8_9BACT|nr:hypothetical protein KL86DES1_10063 [uncultured Desulfovibrio sp.]VZH35275.1 conserved protein of unknown function [Desulfovibrio sp. 86]